MLLCMQTPNTLISETQYVTLKYIHLFGGTFRGFQKNLFSFVMCDLIFEVISPEVTAEGYDC